MKDLKGTRTEANLQTAFAGAAEAMGLTGEEDVQALVDQVRYGKEE